MLFVSAAHAAAPAAPPAGGGIASLIPLLLIMVIFYFLLLRPQAKKMKAHQALVMGLKKGDRVVTAGGIVGIVVKAEDGAEEIAVDIAEGVRVHVLRSTISSLASDKAKLPKAAVVTDKKSKVFKPSVVANTQEAPKPESLKADAPKKDDASPS